MRKEYTGKLLNNRAMLAGSVTTPDRYPPILCSGTTLRAKGVMGGLQVGSLQGAEKQSREVAIALLPGGHFAAELTMDANEFAIF